MRFFFLLCSVLFLWMCRPEVCSDKSGWPVQLGTYMLSSKKTDSAIAVINFGIKGLNKDSVLMQGVNGIKTFDLPLSIVADTSKFIIITGGISDTVSIAYRNIPYFISKQCGYGYSQELSSVQHTKHKIASMSIINSMVDKNDKQNIRVYY